MDARLREEAEQIFRAALRAADPSEAVKARAEEIRSLYAGGGFERMIFVAFGKAASIMAGAFEESLGDLISEGVVITKYGHLDRAHPERVKAFEAGHPVPDENGLMATGEALSLLHAADERTLVVCLISGGGSALLVSPREGITLGEKQEITGALLKAGADIQELNAVRKHLSRVKGGWLARTAYPARVVSLIISDVIGDSLDVIASGPTAPDGTTFRDALEVLGKYSITGPENVLRLLGMGAAGEVPDTPGESDETFMNVTNIIIGSNRGAIEAARGKAEDLGYPVRVVSDALSGEAREAARFLAGEALRSAPRPACLIAGGETTVTVRGKGKGGRNTEMALAFALEVAGRDGITMLSAGTDGTDGPTDAAGAVADGRTVERAKALGLDPEEYLRNNDSYTFFKREGGLLVTGPTGTNVMDLQIILLWS